MCNICARCSKTMLVFWEILLSLSARRVWIEIAAKGNRAADTERHSPRGGCGLKSGKAYLPSEGDGHSPRGGCGLKSNLRISGVQAKMRHSPRGGCGLK